MGIPADFLHKAALGVKKGKRRIIAPRRQGHQLAVMDGMLTVNDAVAALSESVMQPQARKLMAFWCHQNRPGIGMNQCLELPGFSHQQTPAL